MRQYQVSASGPLVSFSICLNVCDCFGTRVFKRTTSLRPTTQDFGLEII